MGTARETVGHDQAIVCIQGLVGRKEEGEGVMMWGPPPVFFFPPALQDSHGATLDMAAGGGILCIFSPGLTRG